MTEALANLEFAAFERSFTNVFRNWDRQYLQERRLACKCPLCGNQYNSVQEVKTCKEQHEKNKARRIEKKHMSLYRHKIQNMAKTIQLEREAEAIAKKKG